MTSSTRRNVLFLMRRHALTGADMDYLNKLSPSELAWLEGFLRSFYDGADPDPAQRKAANRRRYSAKCADAMGKSAPLAAAAEGATTATAEDLLILMEELGE